MLKRSLISKTLWNREIEPTPEKSFLFRYLAPLGKLADNGLVTERIQYSVPNCFPATLAAYRKSTNLQHVTGLFSIFFQILKWTILFHMARHTFGTMSLSAGIPIESIAKMMGHASIASTQIYAQVTDNKISEDMDRLIRKYQKEKAKEEAI